MAEDPVTAWTDVYCPRSYNRIGSRREPIPCSKRATEGHPYTAVAIRPLILTGARSAGSRTCAASRWTRENGKAVALCRRNQQ